MRNKMSFMLLMRIHRKIRLVKFVTCGCTIICLISKKTLNLDSILWWTAVEQGAKVTYLSRCVCACASVA